MRLSLLTLIFAVLLMQSCKKDDISLAEAPREYLIFLLSGNWILEKQRHGFTGEIIPFPPNHEIQFKFSNAADSVLYKVNDTIVQRSKIIWSTASDPYSENRKVTVLSTSIIPFFSVAERTNNAVILYQPAADGSGYFLKRKK